MIEGKGLGNKKVNRVNISLSNGYNSKLNKLATACNMKPTTLAGMLIENSLDNASIVADLQKEYGIHTAYKVLPVQSNGEIVYVMNERG